MTHRNMARPQPIEQAIVQPAKEDVRPTDEEKQRVADLIDAQPEHDPSPPMDEATALETEVEALHAISRAVGALPPASAKRVADWTVAIASNRQHGPSFDNNAAIIKCMGEMVRAVERHQQENEDPSRADAEMYMATLGQLGHHRVSRKALAAYYRDDA